MRLSSSTSTLHTYRHLLREASYLPPICQPYITEQIRSRFDKHKYDRPNNPETKHRIRQARHDLRFLWAANNGLLNNMKRILLLVFGRTGKRRSELIHDLVRREPPSDSDELECALTRGLEARRYKARDGTLKERAPDWLDKWDTDKLQSFASSQSRTNPAASPRPDIKAKQVDPAKKLPEADNWGRPLAATLARSKMRKGYKALANRLLPPVAKSEWDMLRALAMGEADRSLWEMPPRRPRAIQPDGELGDAAKAKDWDWQAYATQPVRSIERGKSRSQRARTGEEVDGPYEQGNPRGLHRYTPRLWRRLFGTIWEMTSVMEGSPGKNGRPNIAWGLVQTNKDAPVAAASHAVFFEGVPDVSRTSGKKRRR